MIDKNSFWNTSHPAEFPLLTNEMVAIAEAALNVKLPELLVELLYLQNGGHNSGFVYPTPQGTSYGPFVPFDDLAGINLQTDVIGNTSNLLWSVDPTRFGFPDKIVSLTGDGHWFIVLDYRKGHNPTIAWIDTECEQDIHLANSFEEFMDGLIASDDYDYPDE